MLMNKTYIAENPIPFVTCTNWVMMEQRTGEVLFQKNGTESRQVASLTKIMTAYVVLELVERFKLPMDDTLIDIPADACNLIGTSA